MHNSEPWLAPNDTDLPDFIIAGAMKSGTTTLHAILNQHPDVYMPEKELHFFDMDNLIQHPEFNTFDKQFWHCQNLNNEPEVYWQWYKQQFSGASNNQLIGEDSTTYINSELALQRLSKQNKKIKLIIMLRQPTARTYSHYWHMVKAGRAMFSFEDMLQYQPQLLLERSAYVKQLKVLFSYFAEEQVKVVLFEDFLTNKVKVLDEICQFLNIDVEKLPKSALELHQNKARIPKYIKLHLLKTRLFRSNNDNNYINYFSSTEKEDNNKQVYSPHFFGRLANKVYSTINPLIEKQPARIHPSTKVFLDGYFLEEMKEINELLKQDILAKWF
ncbi:sulfotransferase family protein [Thalassotalea castellviae]|uniref:Sulfotransferase n=1 Tax=Thalassotalea castellviae TaxID=3075612 RepID=A0ABU3A1G5_9GAMM|nr:sulfotransferase [Thalassotalea sp. W431]MDT0602806.1 sulfotransferase [Thalassotalea sp. W431]